MKITPKPKRNPASRWTPGLAHSWTPIADAFLENYAALDPPITSSEAMLIIHLMQHKWDEKAPYPGFETLGKRMGMTATAVRNHARSLEKKGYLRRQLRVSQTNKFHLSGLFSKLETCVASKPVKAKREIVFDASALETA